MEETIYEHGYDYCFIVKSSRSGEENWSGKEFSGLPAKLYFYYQDAADAIAQYWYGSYNLGVVDDRTVQIVPLTDERKNDLLKNGLIRL